MRLLTRGVILAIGFVLVPYILRHLGEYDYGLWTLAATFLGYYGLADFGISSAVARFISRAAARNDQQELRTVFATSFYLLLIIGALFLVFTVALAWGVRLMTDDPQRARLFFWMIIIMGSNMALQSPLRVFAGFLTSYLRYDLLSSTQIVQAFLRAGLIVWCFEMGYGLLALVVVSAVTDFLSALFRAFLSIGLKQPISLDFKDVHPSRISGIMNYGVFSLIAQLADLLRSRIGPFVISLTLGVAQVTPFALALRLQDIVGRLVLSIMAVLVPVFSHHEGRGDTEALRSLYLFTTRISVYVAMMLGGLMIMLGEPFLELWLANTPVSPQLILPILIVLVVATVLQSAQYPTVGYLFGTSHNDFFAIGDLIQGGLTFLLAIVLLRPMGLIGAAWATLIPGVIIRVIVQPGFVCRQLHIPLGWFLLRQVIPAMLLPLFYLGGVYLVARRFITASYVSLGTLSVVCCLLFVPLILVVGFDAEQRKRLLHAFGKRLSVTAG
jgi:O-antigen/teichoic acid export membrane protein